MGAGSNMPKNVGDSLGCLLMLLESILTSVRLLDARPRVGWVVS